MTPNRHRASGLALALALVLALAAATTAGCLPHEKPYDPTPPETLGTRAGQAGLAVGASIPDPSVIDPDGRAVNLSDVRAKRSTAVVFYKGGWCPPCNYQIHELAKHHAEFERRGVGIIAISVDKPDYAAATIREYGVPFPVLSDPTLVAHKAFGVVEHVGGASAFMLARMGADLEARSGQPHHDVAIPSVFLVDAEGIVRWAHVDPDYSVRPSVPDLLSAIDRVVLGAR
jgi:peroxiredoxin